MARGYERSGFFEVDTGEQKSWTVQLTEPGQPRRRNRRLMRRTRRVKILATLGPASSDKETIAALFDAGADLFRINMSHTSHDMLRSW